MPEPLKAAALRPAEILEDLRGAVRAAVPPCVILTYASSARGEEPHFFEVAVGILSASAKSQAQDVETFDAQVSGFDPKELYSSLTTGSLFSSASLRIVKNTEALWKGQRDVDLDDGEDSAAAPGKSVKRSRDAAVHPIERAALAFVKGAKGGDSLVLVSSKFRAPFLRAMREAGARVCEFRPLYDKPFRGAGPIESTELGDFAKGMARDARVKLAAGALGALLARTGNQLGAVDAALRKLEAVLGAAEVTVADVNTYIPLTRPGNPWALAEAMLLGNASAALLEMQRIARFGARDADGKIIASDGALTMALAAMVRDARRNRDAARRAREGESLDAIARSLGVPPFPAAMEAFTGAVRARGFREHQRLVEDLLEVELSVRVHRESLHSAMQRLTSRSRAGAPRARAGMRT